MLYDFECLECGEIAEEFFHNRNDAPESMVCECGGMMRRLFGLPNYTGWDHTDAIMDVGRPLTGEQDVQRCERITGTSRNDTPGSNPDPRGLPISEYFRRKGYKRKVL